MRAFFGGADRRIRKTDPTKSVCTHIEAAALFPAARGRGSSATAAAVLLLVCALESRLRAAVLLIQCEDNKMLKFDTFAWKCRSDDGASFAADAHSSCAVRRALYSPM